MAIFQFITPSWRRMLLIAFAVVCAGAIPGCAVDVRNAVPLTLADQVQISGFSHIRGWGDRAPEGLDELVAARRAQLRASRPELFTRKRNTVYYLAVSGGGSDGAFGAGFLNGWTASGKRPEFEIVTGVSAGALTAPFAFLGSDYDQQLKEIFTLYSTKDILQPQLLAGLTGGDAVSSSEPLAKLIAKYVDRKFLKAVAREHLKGRRLLVGTTNLDQERPVIWNMGQIATHKSNRALQLFRTILLASASLPGVFPPVYVEVETGGQKYQEMHVDGGTTDNAFLLPAHLDLAKIDKKIGAHWKRRLFVIANLKTGPSAETVKGTALGIAGRSISTLIKQQTEGDLIKIYLSAKKNKIDFNLTSIPIEFDAKSSEPFDKVYMGALYSAGFELARNGYKWKKKPPGL